MSSPDLLKRAALAAGALVCVAAAACLALLAADVARARDTVPASDVRYRVSPQDPDLWTFEDLSRVGLAPRILGVEDDVAFRKAMRAMRTARLDDATVSDPELSLLRNDAQARLEAIASGDGDRLRRSRAANLLGALELARLTLETQDRLALVQSVISNLRLAITLDPTNHEAKYNLELALQRGSGIELTEGAGGANPAPGGSGVKGAGAGDPGSGY